MDKGGLRGRETAKQSETAGFKWRPGEFSLTGGLHQGQSSDESEEADTTADIEGES